MSGAMKTCRECSDSRCHQNHPQDNGLLMMFELSGIPFLAAGEPRITASFDVDASGVLSLDVRDASTGAANAVAPLVDMRRLSEEQLAASTAAEVSLHGADEVTRPTHGRTLNPLQSPRSFACMCMAQNTEAMYAVAPRLYL